ncbi:MAG: hypothetical protein ACR2HJ_01760 [Fimbriimonadales bacterium]
MKPLSHIIPKRRDKYGNTIQQSHGILRPGITADDEAAVSLAKLAATDTKAAAKGHPLLKIKHALAVSENVADIRNEQERKRTGHNGRIAQKVEDLGSQRKEIGSVTKELLPETVRVCVAAGCEFSSTELAGPPAAVRMETDEAIAGELGFTLPKPEARFGTFLLKVAATLGAGTLFGISAGLLAGNLYLEEVASNPAPLIIWAILGTSIISLVGRTLEILAIRFGEASEWYALRHNNRERRFPLALTILTVLVAGAFAAVESKVEQLGIFRALVEETSLGAFSISKFDLFLVSLLLSVPVICFYLAEGSATGIAGVRQAALASERARRERQVRSSQAYAEAAALREKTLTLLKVEKDLDAKIGDLESQYREAPSRSELEQLEDCEIDALAASWVAEDGLLALYKGEEYTSELRNVSAARRPGLGHRFLVFCKNLMPLKWRRAS